VFSIKITEKMVVNANTTEIIFQISAIIHDMGLFFFDPFSVDEVAVILEKQFYPQLYDLNTHDASVKKRISRQA